MFADDLNACQELETHTSREAVETALQKCRTNVHKWGATNRVSFDAAKEHLLILHPSVSHGASFKLLGCMVDTDLRMHSCIEQLMSKIRPKITAILRTRGYYSTSELITQFKTHIWGLMEVNIGGFFHAASSLLKKLDDVQEQFLNKLGISPAAAFLEFNFAPPCLRRNIAALGLLHKRVLGKSHPAFERLPPWYTQRFPEGRGLGHITTIVSRSPPTMHCITGRFFRWSTFIIISRSMRLMQHACRLFNNT